MKTLLRTILFALLSNIFSYELFAQGISNNWLFGYYNGIRMKINFDSLPPVPYIAPLNMNFSEAEATMSDKIGNLLFYSNGIWIANAVGDTMLNGSGISNGSFANQFYNDGIPAQAVLILPNSNDSSKYYMFYLTFTTLVNGYWQPPALFYCKIDMNLDGGLGGVPQKNIPLVQDTLIASELTACKHGNGRDWWIITHRYNSDMYYKFQLTPNGILGPYTQNIGTQMYVRGLSQSCFSPDGKKFACYHPLEDLDVMDFDRCTGNFSNYIHVSINDSAAAGGVAFSPNSKLLYASSTKYVYQFNTSDSNLAASKITVATWDGFYSPFAPLATTFYLSQLAPDGKIYISSTNSVKHYHYITYPDSLGLACNVCQHCMALPHYNAYTVPNHPNYFLGSDSGSVCDTLHLGITKGELRIKNAKVSVFPNPAIDKIQISYTPSEKFQLMEIVDVNGKIVASLRKYRNNSSMTSITPGLYFYQLIYKNKNGEGQRKTGKILITD